MSKHHSFVDTIDQIITDGVTKGILHLTTQDYKLLGNKIHVKDQEIINFGSCSYLGLEFDRRLIDATKEAVENYGTQFSASRAYISSIHYQELEASFDTIFDGHSIVAPTTTLGHIAAIPVLVQDKDAVILDHQVHNSVHIATNLLKPRGIHVELLRHNRIDILEERIKILRQKHERIWYMADGIYSMYGDASPVDEIYDLMNKYSQFYYYVDDAHGMSCYGKHGRGYVLSKKPMHPQMIFATSLAKGFATGGAVLVFPNRELARKVRTCGGPLITSGPMQPATLGAAIASAKIHLSDEIYSMQEDLRENIKYANLMLKKHKLPVISASDSAVFFIAVSLPKVGYNLVKRMLNEGYYLNLGSFPAVPMKNTGVRFTITRLHTFKEIESMISAMAHHFPIALSEEGISLMQIYKAFKLPIPQDQQIEKSVLSLVNQLNLHVEHHTRITDVNKIEWDNLLGERGAFDWNGLKFMQESFSQNQLPENNWEFDYLVIRDSNDQPILATFLTTALWKDDMLSPGSISQQIEDKRTTEDPYYLTSKVTCIGSLFTAGNHLYLNRNSSLWKDAMHLLFEKIAELQEKYDSSTTVVRDLEGDDHEMDSFLVDNGYFKINMPDNHDIKLDWCVEEEYIQQLSSKSRKHLRQDILRHTPKYEISIEENPTKENIADWYRLYLNVKERSLELNTFTFPLKVFENMVKMKQWKIITLRLKSEFDLRADRKPIAVMFTYHTEQNSNFMIIGIDYDFQKEYMCYRQALYQVIVHSKKMNLKKVNLGFAASFEKQKLGATVYSPAAYVQTKDHYNMELIANMSTNTIKT